MLDLRQDLSGLWQAATRVTPRSGGRALMFISAREGEGTSSVAASFALMAAARAARMSWLVDLDLREQPVHRHLGHDPGEPVARAERLASAEPSARPSAQARSAGAGEPSGEQGG